MAHEIIQATTDAVTEPKELSIQVVRLPCTLLAVGLGAGEEVAIYFSPDKGMTWEALKRNGQAVTLTADSNIFKIDSPILLGVTKTATAQPAGVYISAVDNL